VELLPRHPARESLSEAAYAETNVCLERSYSSFSVENVHSSRDTAGTWAHHGSVCGCGAVPERARRAHGSAITHMHAELSRNLAGNI
jgi:hypothetical protein